MGNLIVKNCKRRSTKFNEAKDKNTTELDAAMNGWEELAAMAERIADCRLGVRGDVGGEMIEQVFAGSDELGATVYEGNGLGSTSRKKL